MATTKSGTIIPLNFLALSNFVRVLETADADASRPFSAALEVERHDAPQQVQ
jgi:hypothetical protein